MNSRVIPTRSRIRATKSRARDAVLRRVGPELVELVLTFVDDESDAHAACVSKLWASTRRAWSVALDDCDLYLNGNTEKYNNADRAVIAFAPSGATIALGAMVYEKVNSTYKEHGAVVLLDVRTGRLLWRRRELSDVACADIDAVEFTPDGSLIAVSCCDNHDESILLLDAASGAIHRRIDRCGVKMVIFGGTLGALDIDDEAVLLIDWASGEVRRRIYRDIEPDCLALTGGEDSTTLAVGDESGYGRDKVAFYDAATGDQLREFNLREGPEDGSDREYSYSHFGFSRNGSLYAVWHVMDDWSCGTHGGAVAVYDALTNELVWENECRVRSPHNFPGPIVLFSHDSSTLIGPCGDGSGDVNVMALYDVETGDLRCKLRLLEGYSGKISFSPDDATCAITYETSIERLVLYDVSTGELRRKSR